MRDRILKKIERIEEYLGYIRKLKPDCSRKIKTDPIYRGALFHYLYLISDNCISLAELIIKMNRFAPAESYHEAIDILGDKKIIPGEFAYEFAQIASFRNFLAHDYENVDYALICEEILNKVDDVVLYLKYIKDFLG
jgi:uncharacterized protein YutE (UPF0331/DUF86 family)